MKEQIDSIANNERLEYMKAWRRRNKDKVQKYNAEYWRRRAAKKLFEINEKEVAANAPNAEN